MTTDAILIKKLVKTYPSAEALKGVSLNIKEGELFGLLGPNGAGKTTLIQILTGLCNKTSGEVHLFDKDVYKDYQEARALIGLVPQEFNFDIFEKVYNILFFNAGFFWIPKKEREARIKKILIDLNLWEKKDVQARALSGGMKRKLMIARALMHNPKILILDEPTAGVDVETRRSMWEYFKKLNKEGTTILLTTHYLEEAEYLCERIAIINKGKIIKLDTTEKLLKSHGKGAKLEEVFIHLTTNDK
jgi:ABC-2 type transport system ATP-binding protein